MSAIAYELSREYADKYSLTTPAMINLEGTINNMFDYGMKEAGIRDVLEDIYDNVDFLEEPDEVKI